MSWPLAQELSEAWLFLTRHRLPSLACALASVWGWSGLIGFEPDILDFLVVGLSVMASYELNRITDLEEDSINCAREADLARLHRRKILRVVVSSLAAAQILAVVRTPRWPSVMVTGILILAIAYSVPVAGLGPRSRLKSVPFVKNLVVAIGWAGAVVLYPAFSAKAPGSLQLWAAFALMSTGTFIVEVIWDFRDIDGDARGGIATLPLLIGMRGSRIFLQAICLVAAALILAGWAAGELPWKWTLLLVNAATLAAAFGLLPDHVWRWRPLSNAVVILQTALLLALGVMARWS